MTPAPKKLGCPESFLLTHPVWDVTDGHSGDAQENTISTHTSRVGCDEEEQRYVVNAVISTHTSRVGCDDNAESIIRLVKKFLLTHPVWDVT